MKAIVAPGRGVKAIGKRFTGLMKKGVNPL
jgi:hypothetical protein